MASGELTASSATIFIRADVAQLVEQPIRNRQVTSSTLVVGSIFLSNVYAASNNPSYDIAARSVKDAFRPKGFVPPLRSEPRSQPSHN